MFILKKMAKERMWSNSFINSFHMLCINHHMKLRNFQIAGISLDVASKIYGWKVDALYVSAGQSSDRMQHTGELAIEFQIRESRSADAIMKSYVYFSEQHAERSLQVGSSGRLRHRQEPRRHQRRNQRMKSNIATNKDQINGPVETGPLIDPFFAKHQTISHDMFSAKRLFLNTIETIESSLKFPSNERFWCSRRNIPNIYNEDDEYDWPDDRIVSLPVELNLESRPSMRQHLQGFRVENKTPDSDDEE